MNKDLKSFLWSIAIVLLYIYATAGIIKLLWNTKDDYKFEGRVKFISYLLFIFSAIYVIGIYHVVGPYLVAPFYKVFIYSHLGYLMLGSFVNTIYKH
jgi:hypothetical protein